jgi:hypothetical protein
VVAAIGSAREDWLGVAIFTAAVCVVAAAAAATARETYRVPTARLGSRVAAASPSTVVASTVDS